MRKAALVIGALVLFGGCQNYLRSGARSGSVFYLASDYYDEAGARFNALGRIENSCSGNYQITREYDKVESSTFMAISPSMSTNLVVVYHHIDFECE